jgi:hypothetical protein
MFNWFKTKPAVIKKTKTNKPKHPYGGKEQEKDRRMVEIVNRKTLERYKESNVVIKVEILTAGDSSCEYCKELSRKIFDINEALEKELLPCKKCTYKINSKSTTGWCRCCYAPHV